jgi:hypothetical protein
MSEGKASGRKSLLFLKKKKQKNFVRLQSALSLAGHHVIKVFLLLFFQKNKTLAFFPFCSPA